MSAHQMKTAKEIKARMSQVEASDFLGTQRSDFINYLPFDDAREFLKPEVTREQWDARAVPPPLVAARDYLDFAWGKANDCRGLSAGRSIEHLSAWLWLAGYAELVESHFVDYEFYGKQQLVTASILCDFDWRAHDNESWVNGEDSPSISKERIAALVAESERLAAAAAKDFA